MASDTITVWSSDKQPFEVPHEVACMSEVRIRHWPGCILCVCLQNTKKMHLRCRQLLRWLGTWRELTRWAHAYRAVGDECTSMT